MSYRPLDSKDVDDMCEYGEYPDGHLLELRATVNALEDAENEVDKLRLENEELRNRVKSLEQQLSGKIPTG